MQIWEEQLKYVEQFGICSSNKPHVGRIINPQKLIDEIKVGK